MQNPIVTIVMGTYNGERFLAQQLRSIQDQTYSNWRLIVRDDGSVDGTVELLSRAQRDDSRIRIWDGPRRNLGSCANFASLLWEMRESDYVMCADQDDYWYPNKVEHSLDAIQAAEGAERAARLLFTDFRVVDFSGVPIRAHSPVRQFILEQRKLDLRSLMGFDYVWGCTTIANRPFLQSALPVHSAAVNHDYWMALVASASDSLVYLDETTLDYRKHDQNVTGGAGISSVRNRLLRLIGTGSRQALERTRRHDEQLAALSSHLELRGLATPASAAVLNAYLRTLSDGPWRRMRVNRALGVRRQGPLQEAAHAMLLLRASRRRKPSSL